MPSAFTQDNLNRFLVGGNVGFMYTESNVNDNLLGDYKYNTLSLSISLKAGYFITERIVSGLQFEWNSIKTNYEMSSIDFYNSINYLITPFFRYYIFYSLFGQGQFNAGQTMTEISLLNTSSEENYFVLGYGFGLGYDIRLSENVSLEPLLSYISNKLNDKETDISMNQNSFYINLGIVIKL